MAVRLRKQLFDAQREVIALRQRNIVLRREIVYKNQEVRKAQFAHMATIKDAGIRIIKLGRTLHRTRKRLREAKAYIKQHGQHY